MFKKILLLSFIILFGFATSICTAKYSGGNGSESNPYRISDANDMNDIGLHDEDWGSYFVMVNDVNLAQFTGSQFNIIAPRAFPNYSPFTGVFDGNGFAISNFTYASTGTGRVGLFGYVDDANAVVKNLTLIDPNVNDTAGNNEYTGSLVGWFSEGTITNCYVQGGSVSGDYSVGGLVGTSDGSITNCYVQGGSISGDGWVGGLVGGNGGTMTNCSAEGTVIGTFRSIGGLVGGNTGSITNCYAAVTVSGNWWVGGLVGENCFGGTISDCNTTGTIFGNASTGGVVGFNSFHSTISNCYTTVTVLGKNSTGGLVGVNEANSTISNCYTTVDISGNRRVGGLVGRNINGSIILDCYATGNVDGNDTTGGLVGYNSSCPISNCYATGNVNGNNYTGGLAGAGGGFSNCYATGDVNGNYCTGGLAGSGGSLSNCYATGNVNGNDYTGGLAGLGADISNCYAAGNVNGNDCTGGLAGSNFFYSTISNCYSSGDVTGDDPNTGGLVGYDYNFQTFYTKCFWDRDINPDVNGIGNLTDPNVIGETTVNMQTLSTFTDAGWDFVGETANGTEDIWKMCYDPDYPHLWWEQCPRPSLEMPMHFTPRVLNPKSKGKWVKAHFILPEGFTVGDVNTNSPARIVEPFMAEPNYMDVFEDGLVEIEAAFDRAIFCSNGSMLEDIVVIAQLTTGQHFYGTDTIRIKTNNLEYLAVLTSYWLEADCGEPDWCEGADLDQSSVVDFIDFAFFDGCCLEFIQK